jgi:hypothetical protein
MSPSVSATPTNLSPLAERVWTAICVNDEASESELIVACRPAHPEAVRRALGELERGGLVVKDRR